MELTGSEVDLLGRTERVGLTEMAALVCRRERTERAALTGTGGLALRVMELVEALAPLRELLASRTRPK